MSQHRQHYFEANFRPEQTPDMEHPIARGMVVLMAIAALGAALSYTAARPDDEAPVITPVRTPVVQVYELPPLEADEARTHAALAEGFRAGLEEGLGQQGCTPPLARPIASR